MPGELGAEEIYALARDVGFSPDEAVTMTAIALAESGGDAPHPGGEDSRGLWPIDVEALGNPSWAEGLDLDDPRDNAIAAWHVSQHGTDLAPWTVTHGHRVAPYHEFADEARHAARSHGEAADGRFADGSLGFPPPALPPSELDHGSVQRFLDAALAQQGDRYVTTSAAATGDAGAGEFDCSELVTWAAAQTDVQVSAASDLQYLEMKAAGTVIPVEDAVNTPGALLFAFSAEPVPGQGSDGSAHVAISLGDGRTVEARGDSWGVTFGEAGDRFGYAALIPGMDYSGPSPTIDDTLVAPLAAVPPLPPPAPPAPVEPVLQPAAPPAVDGPANTNDTDHDALPDHFEVVYPLEPTQPDTGGDGITDGYELIVLGTTAESIDTDLDDTTFGLDTVLGAEPLDDSQPPALFDVDEVPVEPDGDGIDWDDDMAGTGPLDADLDDDLAGDGGGGDIDTLLADG